MARLGTGLLLALFVGVAGAPMTAQAQAPVQLTAEQDHQLMLDKLHIARLRPGPSGDPRAPDAANTDEAKVAPDLKLPDPLRLNDGQRVRTARQWWTRRRPEIVEVFDREVYGRVPRDAPKVRWEVVETRRETVGGVPALTKRLLGRVDDRTDPDVPVDIEMALTTPADAGRPVPVILELGFLGPIPGLPPGLIPKAPGPSWKEQVLRRGWGYAILVPTSVQADSGAGLTRGVIGLANHGRPRKPDDWGALRAWAWGASRVLDYFATDPAVDVSRVGIEGLSRYGKAALVAMAYDPRFAIGFIGSSGAGGAKLLRRNFGEQVENLASSAEYHWFAGNFLKYAGPLTVADLPVDAHELIALCAPRPVFVSAGSPKVEGGWVDARGTFLAEVAAGPVYRLLGARGLGTTQYPEEGVAVVGGELAFRRHSGGHTTGPNWPAFLDYAARYFDPPGKRPFLVRSVR